MKLYRLLVELLDCCYYPKQIGMSDLPKSGMMPDPTAEKAFEASEIRDQIKIIERLAKEISPEHYAKILVYEVAPAGIDPEEFLFLKRKLNSAIIGQSGLKIRII